MHIHLKHCTTYFMHRKKKLQSTNAYHISIILFACFRAIPLKKQGKEIVRDHLGQNWDFFDPLYKNGYFSYPHRTRFFLVTPPDSFTPLRHFPKMLPPRTLFLETPPRTKICSFLPPGQKQGFSVPPSDRVI